MADLLTHIATGLLFKAGSGGRHTGVFVVGTALPDLLRSGPVMCVDRLIRYDIMDLPQSAMYPWAVLHMPVGMVLSSFLLCWLFSERSRRAIFMWLLAGMTLHMGLDVLQDHHGQGYFLLYPFSDWTFEFGLYGSEATVAYGPWLLVLSAVAWLGRYFYNQRRGLVDNDGFSRHNNEGS